MRKLYANANTAFRKFGNCSSDAKCDLLTTYCSSGYCSSLWFDSTKNSMKKLKIAYNNSFLQILGIPKYSSASQMFANHNIRSFGERIRKYTVGFINIVISSYNVFLLICVTLLCKFIQRYVLGGMMYCQIVYHGFL